MTEKDDSLACQASAQKIMEGFEFTPLALTERVEVWHCQKPGTGIYHFDITVLPTGMAVTGDIDGLLFNVGSSYGIPFLGHRDKGYVYSKLEESSKKRVVDVDALNWRLGCNAANGVFYALEMLDIDQDDQESGIPDWVFDIDKLRDSSALEIVSSWLKMSVESKFENIKTSIQPEERAQLETQIKGIHEAVEDISHLVKDIDSLNQNLSEIYEKFEESQSLFGVSDTWEYNFMKPSPNIVTSLYMLDEASKQICAIRQQMNEQATDKQDAPRG